VLLAQVRRSFAYHRRAARQRKAALLRAALTTARAEGARAEELLDDALEYLRGVVEGGDADLAGALRQNELLAQEVALLRHALQEAGERREETLQTPPLRREAPERSARAPEPRVRAGNPMNPNTPETK
jgi:hypothetical protein